LVDINEPIRGSGGFGYIGLKCSHCGDIYCDDCYPKKFNEEYLAEGSDDRDILCVKCSAKLI